MHRWFVLTALYQTFLSVINMSQDICLALIACKILKHDIPKLDPHMHTVKNKVCIAHHIWCVQHVSIRTPYLVCYAHLPLAHHFGCA